MSSMNAGLGSGYAPGVALPRRLLPDDPEIGWLPYAWVLYVGFVFLTPVLGELEGPILWWASAAATVAFLPLYVSAWWVAGPKRLWIAVGMALIGMALASVNPGASTFFGFAAYFAGLREDDSRAIPLGIGVILVLALLTGFFVAPTVYFVAPAVLSVVILGPLGAHFARRHLQVAELRLARAEVEALARIAERERIARDLHDLLGHTLSVIVLKSELVAALAERDAARAGHEAREINEIGRSALAEVRTAVRGYRVGSGAGLRQELEGAERSLAAGSVELIVESGPEAVSQRMDAAHEGVVALAIREAATNILRHANATCCRVAFFDANDRFGVEIADDGKGLVGRVGTGLRGMRERVESLGGSLEVSDEGGGTRLVLAFAGPPVEREVSL